MSDAALDTVAPAPTPARRAAPRLPLALAGRLARIALPILSVLGLWYLAILFSGLPAFVIPRPERVLETLVADRDFIALHTLSTLQVALLGLVLANLAGIGLAILFDSIPLARQALMPAAITLRNVPYVALVSVLMLAVGDTVWTKATVVALAGFFPVLVNTMVGLRAADDVLLDRMRVLDATWWETFSAVRLPFAVPHIVAAQQIAGTSAVIVAISAEWMISSEGLGYVINRAMQTYRGDQVYAVALLATALSLGVYGLVQLVGSRLDWRRAPPARGDAP